MLLSVAQASLPNVVTRVRRAGGDHGQHSDDRRVNSSERAADGQRGKLSQPALALLWGEVSTSNRVLIAAKTIQCRVSAVLEVPRGSEHPSPGLTAIGRQEPCQASQGIIPMAGHADLPAVFLRLLAALICTLSSSHSYS